MKKPLQKSEVPDGFVVDLSEQLYIESPNGTRHACVLATCPVCQKKKWIRISFVRCGHTKTSKCQECSGIKFLTEKDIPQGNDHIIHLEHQKLSKETTKKNTLRVLVECPDCHEKRWTRAHGVKLGGYKSTRCTKCIANNRDAESYPLTNNGVMYANGYKMINVRVLPDSDRAMVQKYLNQHRRYVYEHQVVALKKYGSRAAEDGIVVRHLNGIKDDNRPENIAIGTQTQNIEDHMTANHNMKAWRGFALFLLDMIIHPPNLS